MPSTAQAGCRRRYLPTAGPPMPERSSSAGDSSEPQATTTRGARIVSVPAGVTPSSASRTHSTPAARPHEDVGAVLDGVEQPGLVRRPLRARLVAEAVVAGGVRRVAVECGVADDRLEVPAERLAALLQTQVRPVPVAGLVGRADAPEDRVQEAVLVRPLDAPEPELGRPPLAHPRLR